MKKIIGIAAGIAFMLYCFAISIEPSYSYSSSEIFVNSEDEGGNLYIYSGFSADSPILPMKFSSGSVGFCRHTLQQNDINALNNNLPLSFKIHQVNFATVSKLAERLFFNVFTQYILSSRDFLIRFCKTDIIFPFHYFR